MPAMVNGGNATLFVSDMDSAVYFYTYVLGLKLSSRYGNHWATVEAGTFTVGLHPRSEKYPSPGTKGSMRIGLNIDESIDQAAQNLRAQGVRIIGEVLRGDEGNFVHFEDPDGNELYLWEAPKH